VFKVVYDTNVVVSGLLSNRGIPALLLDLVFNKRVSLFLSPEIFDEYERVLRRPIFRIQPRQRESVLRQLRSLGHWTEPRERAEAASDPDDNRFLECALAGEVEFVITGNLRHFPRTFRGTRVVSPRQFFEIYWRAEAPEQN
jgi:putative PIN family toxin of toxin-antitoxin system